ncbi:MAG: HAD family phosphatase [Candidatus Nomurabacteria bacterium]|nr:HAD family phosphatase [Candidatus Saccharibacteria bacterium]USN95573.1 MAG: HAD family phosphatase [Candidatus Nomurabacteria bacterium]
MEKFAVFDIDGTLIRWQLYHAVVNRLAKAKALSDNAQHELKQAMMSWKRRENEDAFKNYQSKLVKLYEQSLPNISTSVFDKLITEVINEYKDQTYIFTRNLIHQLKSKGYKLFIISGSHQELVEQIGKYYNFDDYIGAKYTRDSNGFTGESSIPALNKAKSLEQLITKHKVITRDSIGIGDTKSDISMLEMVDQPIAFNPDKLLFNVAKERGWQIVIERKNVIYKLDKKDGVYVLD